MNLKDWEKAEGAHCTRCGAEAFRLFHGLCAACDRADEAKRVSKLERRRERAFYRQQLQSGDLKLGQLRKREP